MGIQGWVSMGMRIDHPNEGPLEKKLARNGACDSHFQIRQMYETT
jgi:hypothetical protein